jgi:hypothetical protein
MLPYRITNPGTLCNPTSVAAIICHALSPLFNHTGVTPPAFTYPDGTVSFAIIPPTLALALAPPPPPSDEIPLQLLLLLLQRRRRRRRRRRRPAAAAIIDVRNILVWSHTKHHWRCSYYVFFPNRPFLQRMRINYKQRENVTTSRSANNSCHHVCIYVSKQSENVTSFCW